MRGWADEEERSLTATTAVRETYTLAQADRRFFMGMALAVSLIVFVGFAPTYFLKTLYGTPALPSRLVHLHGLLLTSWAVLFVVQSALVSARRTDLHRRLGIAGGLLALAIIPVSLAVTIAAAKHGGSVNAPPIPPLVFMAVPFFDLLLFSTLVSAGLYWRGRGDTHKRLMLLASFALLSAAIGRFFLPPHGILVTAPPLVQFLVDRGFGDLLVLTCMGYDLLTRRRVHPAFLWGGVFLMAVQHLRLTIGGTNAWLTFAGWLVG
jgi:hypothetical protein